MALIEIGGSHDECLLSQLVALRTSGCKVVLVCNDAIQKRNPHFNDWVDEWILVDFCSKAWKDFMIVRKMMRDIKKTEAKTIVFNTAQGGIVRNAVLLNLFSKTHFVGIIHTLRKFQGSTTQKIIFWKVKRYLLLSEYLLEQAKTDGLEVDYFYPLRFPSSELPDKSPLSSLNITLIGCVENRKKDLAGFIHLIQADNNANFTFLGKSDPEKEEVITFKKELEASGLSERVTLYDSFVSHDEFNKVLDSTDAILPLIHPKSPSAAQYFKNKIAGAMTISFSYKIPMLLHEEYEHIKEMKAASIYYSNETFESAIERLFSHKETIFQQMSAHPAYQVEVQEKRYLDFVLGYEK